MSAAASTRDGVASRRRGRKTRQKIIEAARALLIEKGYARFLLRDVAARAGVQVGNLPYYFPTKNDLFRTIFDQEIIQATKGLREALQRTSTANDRLTAIVDAGLALIKKPEMASWLVLSGIAQHDLIALRSLESEDRVFSDVFAEEVAEWLPRIRPGLEQERARHIAHYFSAMLDGISMRIGYGRPETPEARALESELREVMFMLVLNRSVQRAA